MTVRTRLVCRFRHHLWRVACRMAGGLTVSGRWPADSHGCIVVANHASHADTAVIMAALPPSAEPLFAAASDYWFDAPVRRFLVTTLAGALPVRRTAGGGTYAALLAAAKPVLRQGRTVVIYPEGTRSVDRSIGEFHSGAIHLARDCGVPLIPVALLGTERVLPKNGAFTPAPMVARIGEPVDPTHLTATELRARVARLRTATPEPRSS